MDPYPPRHLVRPPKSSLTLSAKEYTKVTGTIASVRRSRANLGDGINEDRNNHERGSRLSKDPSFIAESSFVKAPLNSRVDTHNALPKSKGKGKSKEDTLNNVSLDIQEAMILEDLLFVLMGIEGTHITYHPDYSSEDDDPLEGVKFVVSPSLDASLRDLVERVLPLATYYTGITSFLELRSHLEFGFVNHALCASIRNMLKDYQTLLSQLEHAFNVSPHFSLQKLWFYVHPTLHTLSLIYQLTIELTTADGSNNTLSLPSMSSDDDEDEAKNIALGLGGAKLKAVLSDLHKKTRLDSESGIPVKGGEVISVIYDRMQTMSGDPTALTVYETLLHSAGVPYVRMLHEWMSFGKLHDPWEELCVKESKSITKGNLDVDYTDAYWDKRYTLRDGSTSGDSAGVPSPRPLSSRLPGGACIPPMLEPWKHKVLLAGKYFNVIRECGIELPGRISSNEENLDISMKDEKFYKSIEDAYTYANRTLLNVLMKDQQLLPRLRSLQRIFFLPQSFFVTHFLDLAHGELRKPAKAASIVKLQSLLELALNNDFCGEDSMFREDVRVTMAGSGLYEWLLKITGPDGVIGWENDEGTNPGHVPDDKKKEKGDKKPIVAVDALTLDYIVKFPLSLVISRNTIVRYQLIFRFLFHLKHVEQILSALWVEQMTSQWRRPKLNNPEQDMWKRFYLLRARMLSFVQQIHAFATFEVLEPNCLVLETKLAKVTTVDQLLRHHVDFLNNCMNGSMLTSPKLLRAYSRLMVVCSTFALYGTSFAKTAANQVVPVAEGPDRDKAITKRWEFLGKFETNFDHWFKVHLDCVQFYASRDNVALLPLVVRLNSIKTS